MESKIHSMILSSKNVIVEAIKNKRSIKIIYIDDNFNDFNVLNTVKRSGVEIKRVSKNHLFELTGTTHHQGIAAQAADYIYHELDEIINLDGLKIVILDELSDPHNLGSIIRSADAFKFDAVIIPNSNSVSLNQTVARTSVGSIEYVRVIKVSSVYKTILKLKENGVTIYGTSLNSSKTYDSITYDKKTCLVLGSEGFGIRPLVLKSCDELITIKMDGNTNSLNVSVSAGIIMSMINLKKE